MPKKNKLSQQLQTVNHTNPPSNEAIKINFFEELPAEVVHLIIAYLDLPEMAALSRVNPKIHKTVNVAHCYNFGIYADTSKKVLRPATFKEVSDDQNYQRIERKKADNLFESREKSFKRRLLILPKNESWKHNAYIFLFAIMLLATGISGTLMALSKYGDEKDFVKTFGITLIGGLSTALAVIGGLAGTLYLGEYTDGVAREHQEHQANGRQKLYKDIETRVVRLRQ